MEYKSYNSIISKKEYLERIDNIIIPYAKSASFISNIKLIDNKKLFNKIIKKSTIVYPPYYFNYEKYNFALSGEPVYIDKIIIKNGDFFL